MDSVELEHDNSEAEEEDNDAEAYRAQVRTGSVYHDQLMRSQGFYNNLQPIHESGEFGGENEEEEEKKGEDMDEF